MELILLESVLNLGSAGDLVSVKKGYARNFLLPKGKAVIANDASKAEFETRKELIEKSELGRLNIAKELAEKISTIEVEIKAAVSEEASMYGSIGTREISEGIHSLGYEIAPQAIRLPEGALKELGSYELDIELHPEVIQKIKINITAQD